MAPLFSRFRNNKVYPLVRDIGSTLYLRILGAILTFAFTAFLARILGAEGAGYYFFAFSAAMFLSTIAKAGLDNAIPRFASIEFGRDNWSGLRVLYKRVIAFVLYSSMVMSVAAMTFSYLWVDRNSNESGQISLYYAMSLSIVPLTLMAVNSEFLRSVSDVKGSVLVSSVIHMAVAIVLLAPLVYAYGAVGAGFAFLAATIGSALIAFRRWSRQLSGYPETGSGFTLEPVIASARHYFLISLTGQAIVPYAPAILVGFLGSHEDVAIYSVAARICMIVGLLQFAANIVIAPRFAGLFDRSDFEGLEHVAKSSSVIITCAAAPILLVFALFSPEVMSIFGHEFRDGAGVLLILLLGQLINVATGSVGTLLMMTGYEEHLGRLTLISAVLLLLVCVLTIPSYGAVGAAIGATSSLAFLNAGALWLAERKLGIQASIVPRFRRRRN